MFQTSVASCPLVINLCLCVVNNRLLQSNLKLSYKFAISTYCTSCREFIVNCLFLYEKWLLNFNIFGTIRW